MGLYQSVVFSGIEDQIQKRYLNRSLHLCIFLCLALSAFPSHDMLRARMDFIVWEARA